MFSDSLNYLLFTNPISQGCINATKSLTRSLTPAKPAATEVIKMVPPPVQTLWQILGHNTVWIRAAGVSGASAVALGAWGAHRHFPNATDESKQDLKTTFELANRYHFYHSFALLAVPFAHRPMITGPLMVLGASLFCGTVYYNAVSADRKYNRLAPIGGVTLILAWLSFLL